MNRSSWILLMLPMISLAQQENTTPLKGSPGINFEKGLTWNQIVAKAQKEKKYIFIDCYATWCGPCKKMDITAYSDSTIGSFVNTKFISIKVQMDSTKSDGNEVRKWYADANKIKTTYKVKTFPTYLFFSANGKIVHRDLGYKIKNQFMTLANNASDKKSQYYVLLSKYKRNSLSLIRYNYLANCALRAGDEELANEIARQYIRLYLDMLSRDQLLNKDNIDFIFDFANVLTTENNSFKLICTNIDMIDSIMGNKGFSKDLIRITITNQEITKYLSAAIKNEVDPNWEAISHSVNEKIKHQYLKEIILKAQTDWYFQKKEYKKYTFCLVQQVNESFRNGLSIDLPNMININNCSWDVFLYSNEESELQNALDWIDKIKMVDTSSFQLIDTKANLLYKLGKVEQALELEEQVVDILKEKQIPEKYRGEFYNTLEKMKNGKPTWPTK